MYNSSQPQSFQQQQPQQQQSFAPQSQLQSHLPQQHSVGQQQPSFGAPPQSGLSTSFNQQQQQHHQPQQSVAPYYGAPQQLQPNNTTMNSQHSQPQHLQSNQQFNNPQQQTYPSAASPSIYQPNQQQQQFAPLSPQQPQHQQASFGGNQSFAQVSSSSFAAPTQAPSMMPSAYSSTGAIAPPAPPASNYWSQRAAQQPAVAQSNSSLDPAKSITPVRSDYSDLDYHSMDFHYGTVNPNTAARSIVKQSLGAAAAGGGGVGNSSNVSPQPLSQIGANQYATAPQQLQQSSMPMHPQQLQPPFGAYQPR